MTTDEKLVQLEQKIDALYASVEKVRRYFMWTLIVTVATVALPLLLALVAAPLLLTSYMSSIAPLIQ